MLEGVGHIPMLERGEEVAQIVMDFLCFSSGGLLCLTRQSSEPEGGRQSSEPERGRSNSVRLLKELQGSRQSVAESRGRCNSLRLLDSQGGRQFVEPRGRSNSLRPLKELQGSRQSVEFGRGRSSSVNGVLDDGDDKSIDAYPYLTARVKLEELKK